MHKCLTPGFFLKVKKLPVVAKTGQTVYMSGLKKKYYTFLIVVIAGFEYFISHHAKFLN